VDTLQELTIDGSVETSDIDDLVLKPQIQTIERTVTEQFNATGEKDVGNVANGTITIQNCGSSLDKEIPAGSVFRSPGDLGFETTETVVVPGGIFTPTCTTPGEADVAVRALAAGDKYNLAPASYSTSETGISGFGGQMSGGTTKIAKVVAKSDFDAAKKLLEERNFDEVKAELTALFEGEVVIIEESYEADFGKYSSDPKVGEEAEKATASVKMTFRMMAVEREELTQLIDNDVGERISADQQSIYESGIDNVRFTLDKRVNDSKIRVTLSTFTLVGPEIDIDQLTQDVAGKPFSEARALIEGRPGVRSVKIDFDPFWVSRAPSASKITVNLEIAESTLQ
ncbi:MAG: hypothetical protein R3313_03475, partial [Candidatus Saccharimonadales bacterium]|nr:hypothetical protein [Candidatus Saccharimonadales bacterium]